MNWRPENWGNKNPCIECPNKIGDEWGLFCNLACGLFTKYVYIEAGADAMLEVLRENGEHIEKDKYYSSPCGACSSDEDCRAYESGRLVLIPDEEGK